MSKKSKTKSPKSGALPKKCEFDISTSTFNQLFEAYHLDIYHRIQNVQEFVAGDLNIQSTSKFAIFIQRDDRKYTLGDMNWIMQLIKPGGKTLSKSPLLQDFRNFALRYFEKRIVEKKYLDSINTINEEFRKKAAHPYVLGLELAKECQQLIRLTLKEFLASYLVQGR